MSQNIYKQILLKIKADVALIQLISYEWRRIHGFSVKAAKETNRELYKWNYAEKIQKWNLNNRQFEDESNQETPEDVILWFRKDSPPNSILLMEDLHLYFSDPMRSHRVIGQLRVLSRNTDSKNLIFSQPYKLLPRELEKETYVLDIPLPKSDIMLTVIKEVVSNLKLTEDKAPESAKLKLAEAVLGLTNYEAKYALTETAIRFQRLSDKEIPYLVKFKEQIIKKSGILEYFHPKEEMADVGGMDQLKQWLKNRKSGFDLEAKDFGLTPPKGVLLLGIQGCGKSLIAKAMGSEWNLPLLKFDLGKVFGGIVGESESNIRKALDIAEAIAPSILWVDEIEKGLSGVGSSNFTDGGTTARVFGTLLTWMQEKNEPVFVVATANNIEQLPPELLRKGRFDEIFFVDLPGSQSRSEIWELHLRKRLKGRFEEISFDFEKLSDESKGYSGAEIEEAINEALYTAYNNNRDINTKDLVGSIRQTFPLSKVMREKITGIRDWAKTRARMASNEPLETIPEPKEKIVRLKTESDNPFIE